MVMPYYEVPVDILEKRELLAEWGRKSLNASRNKLTKLKKPRLAKGGQLLRQNIYLNGRRIIPR